MFSRVVARNGFGPRGTRASRIAMERRPQFQLFVAAILPKLSQRTNVIAERRNRPDSNDCCTAGRSRSGQLWLSRHTHGD